MARKASDLNKKGLAAEVKQILDTPTKFKAEDEDCLMAAEEGFTAVEPLWSGLSLGPHNLVKSKLDEVKDSRTKYVLWTGGFDSTYLVIRHLNDPKIRSIQPIYMKHSVGYVKCELEQVAQAVIREHYTGAQDTKLRPTIYWDYAQLADSPLLRPLHDTIEELADTLELSHQYSALRFCKMVMGWDETKKIEVGLVRNDEASERLTMSLSADGARWGKTLTRFFSGFEFPLINTLKTEIWDSASPSDRIALKMTFSCERADSGHRTCEQQKMEFTRRCSPCKHRLGVLSK